MTTWQIAGFLLCVVVATCAQAVTGFALALILLGLTSCQCGGGAAPAAVRPGGSPGLAISWWMKRHPPGWDRAVVLKIVCLLLPVTGVGLIAPAVQALAR